MHLRLHFVSVFRAPPVASAGRIALRGAGGHERRDVTPDRICAHLRTSAVGSQSPDAGMRAERRGIADARRRMQMVGLGARLATWSEPTCETGGSPWHSAARDAARRVGWPKHANAAVFLSLVAPSSQRLVPPANPARFIPPVYPAPPPCLARALVGLLPVSAEAPGLSRVTANMTAQPEHRTQTRERHLLPNQAALPWPASLT